MKIPAATHFESGWKDPLEQDFEGFVDVCGVFALTAAMSQIIQLGGQLQEHDGDADSIQGIH